MKRILILGGTGAMGRHLVAQLSTMEGVFLTITSRSPHQGDKSLEYVVGDAHDEIFINSLLSKCHWEAIVDFMIYSTSEFSQKVNNYLSATDQYVFLSSARVYAESKVPLTENSPRLLDVCEDAAYLKTDEYALSKARQEDFLKKSGRRNWTIIRPYITFSEIRLQLGPQEKELWLYRALHNRTILFSEDLADKLTTLTYGRDVAQGIAALLDKKETLGEVFHITTSESHTWREILEVYLNVIRRETGITPKVLLTSKWQNFHGGGEAQVKYDRLYDRCFDNSKISQYTDLLKSDQTLQSLDKCLTDFLHSPHFRDMNWANEARKDRFTNEWTPLNEIVGIKQKLKYILIRLGIWRK
jgi:nucleoside-diphosphate-sugar epimerase